MPDDDPTTGDNGTVTAPAAPDPLEGVDPHVRELLDRANGEAKQRRLHERQLEEEIARRDRERETEQERIIREAKQEAIAEKDAEIDELKKEHLREQVRSRLIAAAAGKLKDPNDAPAYIDPAPIADEPDEEKRATLITERIAKLVKDKPYLAAEASPPRPPLVAQGAPHRTVKRPATRPPLAQGRELTQPPGSAIPRGARSVSWELELRRA